MMNDAVEITSREAAIAASPRPVRALPTGAVEPGTAEALIRRLAADRLRDLADDGVTLGYVARMYDVSPDRLERLRDELIPSRR